jgi:hypothetical protein
MTAQAGNPPARTKRKTAGARRRGPAAHARTPSCREWWRDGPARLSLRAQTPLAGTRETATRIFAACRERARQGNFKDEMEDDTDFVSRPSLGGGGSLLYKPPPRALPPIAAALQPR